MRTELIKTGDVANCLRRKSFFSWIIYLFTKGKYTHTASFIRYGNELFVIDAQKDGFTPKHFNVWMDKYKYKFELKRKTYINEEEFIKRAEELYSRPYDVKNFIFRHPLKAFRKWLNRFRRNKLILWKEKDSEKFKEVVCSEAIAYLHQEQNAESLTPQEYAERQALPNYYQVTI